MWETWATGSKWKPLRKGRPGLPTGGLGLSHFPGRGEGSSCPECSVAEPLFGPRSLGPGPVGLSAPAPPAIPSPCLTRDHVLFQGSDQTPHMPLAQLHSASPGSLP